MIAETANRLRLVQLDLADEGPEMREGCLADVVEQAMAAVLPDDREEFLEQLQQRFPSWDSQVELKPADEGAIPRSSVDESALTDASFLVTQLERLAPSLSDTKRDVVRDRLAAAGLAHRGDGALRKDSVQTITTLLDLPKDSQLDPARLMELLGLLVKHAVDLNKVTGKAWREIAPNSPYRLAADLRKPLGNFVAHKGGGKVAPAAQDIEHQVRLMASLVSAIRGSGRTFAQRVVDRLSPSAIETLVDMEKKFMKNREIECWRKYREVAKDLDVDAIEREILKAIGDYAGRLLERNW